MCCSFTTKNLVYNLSLDDSSSFIQSCNCPDRSGICKHMFLLSRTHAIPYHSKDTYSSVVRDADLVESEAVIREDEQDRLSLLLERQKELRWDTLSESLDQALSLLAARAKELKASRNFDFDLLENTIQNIKNCSSSIENGQHPYQHPPTQRR